MTRDIGSEALSSRIEFESVRRCVGRIIWNQGKWRPGIRRQASGDEHSSIRAPRGRLELPTLRLTAECSAIELTGNGTSIGVHSPVSIRPEVFVSQDPGASRRSRFRRRWTREAILRSIDALHEAGADLSYSAVHRDRGALYAAAIRLFGDWSSALRESGVTPARVRRRQRWTDEGLIERIASMAAAGHDLSWTAVINGPDRMVAYAAARSCHFGSWQAALAAAGITERTRRRRRWDARSISRAVLTRRREGLPLNAKAVERDEPALIAAARRIFGTWNDALKASAIDPETVALRKSPRRLAASSPL